MVRTHRTGPVTDQTDYTEPMFSARLSGQSGGISGRSGGTLAQSGVSTTSIHGLYWWSGAPYGRPMHHDPALQVLHMMLNMALSSSVLISYPNY